MVIEIDLTQLAGKILANSENDIQSNWTNNLVDTLEEIYGFETALSNEIVKAQKAKLFYCCLCNRLCTGGGNDPAPLETEGRCCDTCNSENVIPARILQHEALERAEAENERD